MLDRQINDGLDGLTAEQLAQLVIAYEPVWAIGTGRNATPEQAAEAHAHIRQRLRQWFGAEPAERCHVIYGGSVKPDNIADLVGAARRGRRAGRRRQPGRGRSFAEIVSREPAGGCIIRLFPTRADDDAVLPVATLYVLVCLR